MFALLCISVVMLLLNFGETEADKQKPPNIDVCFGNYRKNVGANQTLLAHFDGSLGAAKGNWSDDIDDTVQGCKALCLKLPNCLAIFFLPKVDTDGALCLLTDGTCNARGKDSKVKYCIIPNRKGSDDNEHWRRTDTTGIHPVCPKIQSQTNSTKAKTQPANITDCFVKKKTNVQVSGGTVLSTIPFQGLNVSASGNLHACQSLCLKAPTCKAFHVVPDYITLCVLHNVTCNDKDQKCPESKNSGDYWERTDANGSHPQCSKTKSPKPISNKVSLGVTGTPTTPSVKAKKQG